MLAHQTYLSLPQRPRVEPLFTNFTSIERSIVDAQTSDDTDFEDDGSSISDFDDYSPGYPDRRISQSTISTVDEIPTPLSTCRSYFDTPTRGVAIQGPTGPHLFRASIGSHKDLDVENALQLSPLFSKSMTISPSSLNASTNTLAATVLSNYSHARTWSINQVAWWMLGRGLEHAIIDKFEFQEIDGAILLDLDFDDLKVIGISSSTQRQQIWSEIETLRNDPTGVNTTATKPQYGVAVSRTENRQQVKRNHDDTASPVSATIAVKRRGRMNRANFDDAVTPEESISIVAIEQLIPKMHICKRGEACRKWQRQMRLIDLINKEHGCNISPSDEDQLFISGFPGNAQHAESILRSVVVTYVEPRSTSTPSTERNTIRNSRKSQLAHDDLPRLEMFPSTTSHAPSPQHVSSPQHAPSPQHAQSPQRLHPQISRSASAQPWISSSPTGGQQTSVVIPPVDPIPRKTCASAPPTTPSSTRILHSVSSNPYLRRRPSEVLETLHEVTIESANTSFNMPSGTTAATAKFSPKSLSTTTPPPASALYGATTTRAGWTQHRLVSQSHNARLFLGRRKHEWHARHVRLVGTVLSLHGSSAPTDTKVLETIDVNDYAVACRRRKRGSSAEKSARTPGDVSAAWSDDSSPAGGSSLAAFYGDGLFASALRALRRKSEGNEDVDDHDRFEFQLVPGLHMRGQAKARHEFAVATGPERSEWMREVMLAKALRMKNEGWEVSVCL